MSWREALIAALTRRYAAASGTPDERRVILRTNLVEHELPTIVAEVKCIGKTPDQTMSKVIQNLRDAGLVDMPGKGRYRLTDRFLCRYIDAAPAPVETYASVGEALVARCLRELGVTFERQKRFADLRYKTFLSFDIWFERGSRQYAVEFDGLQHRQPVEHFGGQETFEETQKRDAIKNAWAVEHLVYLIRLKAPVYSVIAIALDAVLFLGDIDL